MKTKTKGTRSHLPPTRRHGRRDDGDAFVPESGWSRTQLVDEDAESLAEEMLAEVTSAEHVGEDARNEESDDERIGSYSVDFTLLDEDASQPS